MMICIGIGPGNVDYITHRGAELIRDADVVVGFDAVIDFVKPLVREDAIEVRMGYRDQVPQLKIAAKHHHEGKKCVALFMGDVHFSGFQFLERVETACGHEIETLPGISSAQMLASKGRVCFDETTFLTFHRRGDVEPFKKHLVNVLKDDRNAIVIPLPWSFMPKDIAAYLIGEGIPTNHPVEVWENLSRENAEWSGTLEECVSKEFTDMSIMLIRTLNPMPSQL